MELSEETRRALPNLFIIGAPKAGTTSLHAYLSHHPEIAMSRIKECRCFERDVSVPGQPAHSVAR